MTEVLSAGVVRTGDDVLEVGVGVGVLLFIEVGVGVLLFTITLLRIKLFGVLVAEVMLLATDGDGAGDSEGAAASDGVVVTVEDEEVEVVRGGVGVLELAGDMNSFKIPAGTDIMGAPAVSRSFMVVEGLSVSGAGVRWGPGLGEWRQ